MTEFSDPQAEGRPVHPGGLIRAAREARGWSLAHMAMLLKLSERRLQAFEEGRWDDVGDRTFVRALAQSLCRHLSIDPAPLLQSLPPVAERAILGDASTRRMPSVGTPASPASSSRRAIRGTSGRAAGWAAALKRPVVLVVLLILLAAAALAFMPGSWWSSWRPAQSEVIESPFPANPANPPSPAPTAASAPVDSIPALPASQPSGSQDAVIRPAPAPSTSPTSTPQSGQQPNQQTRPSPGPQSGEGATGAWGTPSASSARAPVVAPLPARPAPQPSVRPLDEPSLQITVTQTSWVQVIDARGQVLVSRLVPSGERVELVGARPLNLRVGNVAGVQAQWRGQRVDLDSVQRSNVAQVDLP